MVSESRFGLTNKTGLKRYFFNRLLSMRDAYVILNLEQAWYTARISHEATKWQRIEVDDETSLDRIADAARESLTIFSELAGDDGHQLD